MIDASLNRDAEQLESCIELLEYERETWKLLMDKVVQERAQNHGDLAAESITQVVPQAPTGDDQPRFVAEA